jgi:hypothetical protein
VPEDENHFSEKVLNEFIDKHKDRFKI